MPGSARPNRGPGAQGGEGERGGPRRLIRDHGGSNDHRALRMRKRTTESLKLRTGGRMRIMVGPVKEAAMRSVNAAAGRNGALAGEQRGRRRSRQRQPEHAQQHDREQPPHAP